MSNRRDADVDTLLGFNDSDDEDGEKGHSAATKGWFSWLFGACAPRPPISLRNATRKLSTARVTLDNRRAELMVTYEEHMEKAREYGREHKQKCGEKPLLSCDCNPARTARSHMQSASSLKKEIASIESQFSVASQQQSTLESMETVRVMRDSMSAANAALTNELKKHGHGHDIEKLQDELSENNLQVTQISQSLGATFNYTTGETVTGIEMDPSILEEMCELLESGGGEDREPTPTPLSAEKTRERASSSNVISTKPTNSRRIRRPHEIPSPEAVPQ